MEKLLECPNCKRNKRKIKNTLCRECFLGSVKFSEEKNRLKDVRKRRRKRRPRRFRCEMEYYSCQLRGYCNGDC